jgi:fido (protein-threonine AMPylation protein)
MHIFFFTSTDRSGLICECGTEKRIDWENTLVSGLEQSTVEYCPSTDMISNRMQTSTHSSLKIKNMENVEVRAALPVKLLSIVWRISNLEVPRNASDQRYVYMYQIHLFLFPHSQY